MQPEPIGLSTRINNLSNTSNPSRASQHGFLPNQLDASDQQGSREQEHSIFAEAGVESDAAGDAVADGATLQHKLRRLSSGDSNGHRPKPSFHRISEYENALSPTPPRKPNDGPAFKVVRRKGNRRDGPQLDTFPNEVLTHILSHLPAASLSAVSLVSRRFYSLVTTPHAWRVAFSRFFPGQDAIGSGALANRRESDQDDGYHLRSERRFFTRLTALASWRSEYILRTRLLRSLARGKPAQIAPGHGASPRSNSAANNANAVVTYNSQLFSTVNHIHAVFGSGKKSPRFIHGTDETGSACTSDPNIGKIDSWGLSDPQFLPQFADLFVGDLAYGLGDGPAGLPNSMDVSLPHGVVCGGGYPGGQVYFRASEELRGRFLTQPDRVEDSESGIPKVPRLSEAVSAVWISKSHSVMAMTDGLVGIMIGSTLGIVTTYSLGADYPDGRRIGKGQITGRWTLSPGVPIICIQVDDSYNLERKSSGRIWAVALNALGEVFYLTETPSAVIIDSKLDENSSGRYAWITGRTAYWHLAEPTRRVAREDPYNETEIHGSYSPRSSSASMQLSRDQIIAETLEIEKFLGYRPSHFRKICDGWDMRRKLEVDFAGDDGNGAGEGIFVIKCGIAEGEHVQIKRHKRCKFEQASLEEYPVPKTPPIVPMSTTMASLFGGGGKMDRVKVASLQWSPVVPGSPRSKPMSPSTLVEEWRSSLLSLKDQTGVEIMTSAVDMSTYSLLTIEEDPLRTINGGVSISSPYATPPEASTPSAVSIPGHRARFMAVGTKTGVVMIWNMRGPQSTNPSLVNELQPAQIIQTDSPQISCLAVSALCVVHGGNDGLVQAWDPLASTLQPVRTLNSRFASRARRRLAQAEASTHGVGINLYAAGAIVIDPDAAVLRGMVSLGTHLRYWSYSSSAVDQYQSKKRRLRRSGERRGSAVPDRFTNTGRGALLDYIATEQEELRKEKIRRSREEARLRGRFGVGLGGLSDEEALRYAEMVSAETFQRDEERRINDAGYFADAGESPSAPSVWSSETMTPESSVNGLPTSPQTYKTEDQFEHDLEEAIRLSLLDGVDEGGRSPRASGSGEYDIPITYKQKKSRRSASSSPSTSQASKDRVKTKASGSKSKEAVAPDDLDFALRLSLAEDPSSAGADGGRDLAEEYPTLQSPLVGKGKGRAT